MQKNEKPTNETLEMWHKDPNNWKWGFIYFNKKDKRIFPPKKIKSLGWTVNFANPLSILPLVVLVVVVSAVSFYFKTR